MLQSPSRRILFSPPRSGGGRGVVLVVLLLAGAGVGLWRWGGDRAPSPPPLSREVGSAPVSPALAAPAPEAEVPSPGSGSEQAAPAARPEEQEPERPRGERVPRAGELDALRATGDADALRRRLGVIVLEDDLAPAVRARLLDEMDALNRRLLYSATPLDGFASDTVRQGESYWTISRRLRKDRGIATTPGLLELINGVPAARLRAGQPLKVPVEDLSLLVDKSEFTLFVLIGGIYAKRYPIGIGREGSTPEGTFVIGGKAAKPTWRDPSTGRTYRFGEEGHVIGTRWMAFLSDGRSTGYGIHGTIDPESVGRAESEGCIRLRNEEVEELFDLVPEGAPVVIRP